MLAAIIFMAILTTIIVQATSARWVAGRLGLLVDDPAGRAIKETVRAVPAGAGERR